MVIIRKFNKWPTKQKKLLFSILCNVLYAKIIIMFVPFRYYIKSIGYPNASSVLIQAIDETELAMIKSIFHNIQKYLAWFFKCFEQAVAAKKLLNKRHIPSCICFGLTTDEGKLKAHAWVRCGDSFVTGRVNKTFTEILKVC